jgi:MFS-type transporter involved in bile tolerance (Atg22 family)
VLLETRLTSMRAPGPALLLLGAGLGLAGSPSQSASMSAVTPSKSGVAAGMLATLRYTGGIVGTLALSVVLGSTKDVDAVLASHHTAVVIFLASACAAIPCAWLLPDRTATRHG